MATMLGKAMTIRSMPGEIVVVLASANRRGAELQGSALVDELVQRGDAAKAIALAPATSKVSIDVPVLGPSPLSRETLRSLHDSVRDARVVIAYGSWTLPTCALTTTLSKVPFIYRSIGNPADWVRGPLHRARTGVMFRRATRTAALFPAAAQSIQDLYSVKSERVRVIPNARNPTFFYQPSTTERARAKQRFGVPTDRLVIAFVGSLAAEKRLNLLVHACSLVDGATTLIAGSGPLRDQLEERIVLYASESDIRLLGAINDVRPVLAAADVVVLTSATEGMPGVIIEAALMGTPCVATDVGAIRDVVGPGGKVLPTNSPADDIAGAVRSVAMRRDEYGALARNHALRNFSWDVVVPQWQELIREATDDD